MSIDQGEQVERESRQRLLQEADTRRIRERLATQEERGAAAQEAARRRSRFARMGRLQEAFANLEAAMTTIERVAYGSDGGTPLEGDLELHHTQLLVAVAARATALAQGKLFALSEEDL